MIKNKWTRVARGDGLDPICTFLTIEVRDDGQYRLTNTYKNKKSVVSYHSTIDACKQAGEVLWEIITRGYRKDSATLVWRVK